MFHALQPYAIGVTLAEPSQSELSLEKRWNRRLADALATVAPDDDQVNVKVNG